MTRINKEDALAALNTLKDFGLQEGKAGLKSAKEHGMKFLAKAHQVAANKYTEKQAAVKEAKNRNEEKSKITSFNLSLDDKHTIDGQAFLEGGKVVGMSEFLDADAAICILKVANDSREAYLFATKNDVYCPANADTNRALALAYNALGEKELDQTELMLLTKGINNEKLGTISTQN